MGRVESAQFLKEVFEVGTRFVLRVNFPKFLLVLARQSQIIRVLGNRTTERGELQGHHE
jgi:hypothetical protein